MSKPTGVAQLSKRHPCTRIPWQRSVGQWSSSFTAHQNHTESFKSVVPSPHPRPKNLGFQGWGPDISVLACFSGDCKVQLSLRTHGSWLSPPNDMVQAKSPPQKPDTFYS